MRILVKLFCPTLLGLLLLPSISFAGDSTAVKQDLSALEIFQGWKNIDKRTQFIQFRKQGKANLVGAWLFQAEQLTLLPGAGDLYTRESYENFELKFDWKTAEKGDASVVIAAPHATTKAWQSGFRFVLSSTEPQACRVGDCFDLYQAKKDLRKGFGSWNSAKIVKKGGRYQFFINGQKTIEFEAASDETKQAIEKSLVYHALDNFGKRSHGAIVFEDRGSSVELRNIRVRKLNSFIASEPENEARFD